MINKRKNVPFYNLIAGMLNEENEWCSKEEDISAIIQNFYQNLFTSSLPDVDKIEELLIAVQPSVTEEMSRSLERAFTTREVKKTVFSMSADKSPGIMG